MAATASPPTSRQPAGRANCGRWTDGELSALIEAWGPLYRSSGGRLAPKQWYVVVCAVNAHRVAVGRPSARSEAQCRTRVQSLKKQYRRELGKPSSNWRHLSRLLDFLPPSGLDLLAASAAKEREKEKEVGQEQETGQEEKLAAGGSWVMGGSRVPTRPRNPAAAAGCGSAAALTMFLGGMLERVHKAALEAEMRKMEMMAAGRNVKPQAAEEPAATSSARDGGHGEAAPDLGL